MPSWRLKTLCQSQTHTHIYVYIYKYIYIHPFLDRLKKPKLHTRSQQPQTLGTKSGFQKHQPRFEIRSSAKQALAQLTPNLLVGLTLMIFVLPNFLSHASCQVFKFMLRFMLYLFKHSSRYIDKYVKEHMNALIWICPAKNNKKQRKHTSHLKNPWQHAPSEFFQSKTLHLWPHRGLWC